MGSMVMLRPTSWSIHRERIYMDAFRCEFVYDEPDLMTVLSVNPIQTIDWSTLTSEKRFPQPMCWH